MDDGSLIQSAYMDYQSTTPLDERVLAAMMPYLTTKFGNPHSAEHRFGWEAEVALDVAREQVAKVVGAQAETITFLSGATEANNLALKGVLDVWGEKQPHLITVATEHKCVLEAAVSWERRGFNVTFLPVGRNGLIDLKQLKASITSETALVSVMAVNNEIGVIHPLHEIGALCREKEVLFHTDAAQAYGKIPIAVDKMNIDFMSISAHKIYGPKGIGALYRRRSHKTALEPQMLGGGQEGGLRAGTQAPALVAGFGKAAQICGQEMAQEEGRLRTMMIRLIAGLKKAAPGMIINGDTGSRWIGNLNVCFPGLDGDRLFADVRGLAVSSGAACASATTGPSYVLEAIGLSDSEAKSSLRLGIGRQTTDGEIDYAISKISEAVAKQGGCSKEGFTK
ncbi:cysteine desulfurase family protein [Kordiimonas aquimaris]|uniref:cysteine desulfurase family protein n=1 Tax=Kordiimonas aquimaris TaxID=707591 RepID=UPI0021CEE8AB|nr:aminotransferase class V-fold PLP-dependent enzyme [Kordiimonas aquimaris]